MTRRRRPKPDPDAKRPSLSALVALGLAVWIAATSDPPPAVDRARDRALAWVGQVLLDALEVSNGAQGVPS